MNGSDTVLNQKNRTQNGSGTKKQIPQYSWNPIFTQSVFPNGQQKNIVNLVLMAVPNTSLFKN